MSKWFHLEHFGGLPAHDFPRSGEAAAALPAAAKVAWRIAVESYDSEESWPDAFARFTASVDLTQVTALIIGSWGETYEQGPEDVIAAVLAVRDRLPALRHLFLGDIVQEECEISWIVQGDVGPLLDGFPRLETFGVRGGTSLVVPVLRHGALRSLTVETGGMPAAAVRNIAAGDFPSLVHLDLWLGTSEYGADSDVSDLAPILDGTRLPALRSLSLCNSEMQDAIATAIASAPVVARLEKLDLSKGVLTDDGATALLEGQPLTHLRELDLRHNYLTNGVRARLRDTLEPAGVRLDADSDNAEEDEDEGRVWRFVAVGE